MDALEAILSRRSIRDYLEKPVDEEAIETILRAAMSAPSANNHQPWYFVVINDREILDSIPTFHPYANMLRKAPVAILVCGDTRKVDHPGYLALDCSAATENLLLAAHAIGLGAVWLGIFPRKKRIDDIRQTLNIPPEIEPIALISLGYPAENKAPANRFDKNKIVYNRWGGNI